MKTKFIYLVGILIGLLVLLRIIHASSEGFTDGSSASGSASIKDSFTLYYAEWCPHCKAVKPAFSKWAKDGFVSIGGKNITLSMVEPEKEPEKAKGKTIKGYPTLLLEKTNGETVEFEGERTPEGYAKFLEQNVKA